MTDVPAEDIRVRNEQGEYEVLRYNEPRPDQEVEGRPTRMVDPGTVGNAGIRLRAEQILSQMCGPKEQLARLRELGPDVGPVLVKIGRQADDRGSGPFRRSGAVAALGSFPTAEVADFLRELLSDRSADEGLRAQAALSLGRIGSPSAIDALQQVLGRERSAAVRHAAAKGLALSTSLQATAALERAAEHDDDVTVRQQAYAGLRSLERLYGSKLTTLRPPPRPRRRHPEPGPAPEEPERGT
jgi:HEAT repeat protein